MKRQIRLTTLLRWIPSLVLITIFIPNALDKILGADSMNKVIQNPIVLIGTGCVLLAASILFLINKTMLIGTTILALYMSCIVLIHMYKGKPHEVAVMIVMATVLAAYLRRPEVFRKE